jgi:hypothetical protein
LVVEHFLLELGFSTGTVNDSQLEIGENCQVVMLRLVKAVGTFEHPSSKIIVLDDQDFLLVAVRQEFFNNWHMLSQNGVIISIPKHL